MRKYLFVALLSVMFMSCHESLEERAEREAREFTKKNCPMSVSENIVNDSMAFEKDTRTIHYYYSLRGRADTTAIDMKKAKEELVKGVKDATGIRKYKESDFNFAYTYYSTKNKGQVLIKIRVTPEDYKTE